MEKPLFFRNGEDKLFGVLHLPEQSPARAAILLCHPFGEEKLWSHRVYVNFAREAANRGLAVLRFDFRGHGDSDGQSEDNSLDSFAADIESAMQVLRSEVPAANNVGILGLRLGATLAWLRAARDESLRWVMLWDPIMIGERYMQELLRINLSTQLAIHGKVRKNRETLVAELQSGSHVNVDGYLIGHKLFADCCAINMGETPAPAQGARTLIVQIAPNINQKDRVDLLEFADGPGSREFVKTEEPPFWREIKPFTSRTRSLVRETLDWLEKQIDD